MERDQQVKLDWWGPSKVKEAGQTTVGITIGGKSYA